MIMDPMQPQYRRRQYLVAVRFQLKYVGMILALMFLTAALCSYLVYYTTMVAMGEKLASVYPQGRLISVVSLINLRILVSLILITPIITAIGIFLSHRIAGPIARMERFLNGVAAGDLSTYLTLRKKDELVNLANGINRVIDSMRESVNIGKGRIEKISMALDKVRTAAESKLIDKTIVNRLLDDVGDQLNAMFNDLERYKLTKPSQ